MCGMPVFRPIPLDPPSALAYTRLCYDSLRNGRRLLVNTLREKRLTALLTVRELSEKSGVSEDTITKIENGHRKGRDLTLWKLEYALSGERVKEGDG
jgi:DNA-binding XRE family transcriptional regulator